MTTDEQEIRGLVSRWMEMTKAGDVDGVLQLMADDVVFLRPGQPPMTKAGFAAAAKAQAKGEAPKFDGTSEIQEIKVLGEWAFMWSKLTVVASPPDGSARSTRAGPVLSILKKENGKWVWARDANMLAPVKASSV
jgi:uncharacterized protein (TIGR02246 family)